MKVKISTVRNTHDFESWLLYQSNAEDVLSFLRSNRNFFELIFQYLNHRLEHSTMTFDDFATALDEIPLQQLEALSVMLAEKYQSRLASGETP